MKRTTRRALGLSLALFAVVVLSGLLAVRLWAQHEDSTARARFQKEAGPLRLSAYAPAGVEREANAAVWFRAAGHALVLGDEEEESLSRAARTPAGEWDAGLRRGVEAVLEQTGPARELLARAARFERSSYDIDYAAGLAVDQDFLLPLFKLSRLPVAQARLRLLEADLPGAVAATRIAARLADSLRRESVLLAMLFANAVESQFLSLVQELLAAKIGPDGLSALADELAQLDRATQPLARIFAFEGAAGYAATSGELAAGYRPDWGPVRSFLFGWMIELGRSASLDTYRELAQACRLPYPEFVQ